MCNKCNTPCGMKGEIAAWPYNNGTLCDSCFKNKDTRRKINKAITENIHIIKQKEQVAKKQVRNFSKIRHFENDVFDFLEETTVAEYEIRDSY